jgi:hypothetical protein
MVCLRGKLCKRGRGYPRNPRNPKWMKRDWAVCGEEERSDLRKDRKHDILYISSRSVESLWSTQVESRGSDSKGFPFAFPFAFPFPFQFTVYSYHVQTFGWTGGA